MNYKQPKTPFLILIAFFLSIAAFDTFALESTANEPIVVEVRPQQAPNQNTSSNTFFANILK